MRTQPTSERVFGRTFIAVKLDAPSAQTVISLRETLAGFVTSTLGIRVSALEARNRFQPIKSSGRGIGTIGLAFDADASRQCDLEDILAGLIRMVRQALAVLVLNLHTDQRFCIVGSAEQVKLRALSR